MSQVFYIAAFTPDRSEFFRTLIDDAEIGAPDEQVGGGAVPFGDPAKRLKRSAPMMLE